MIHVAYRLWGGDGFFAKMLGTSMLSMFENTKEKVTVHIMHNDRLTPDNRGKLCYIAGQYNQHVEFHNVELIAGSSLRKFEKAYPIPSGINAAWFPFILHEVFPELDKLIFLGADTVFYSLDIAELWQIELNEQFPFGAVAEFTKWGEAYGAKLCYDGLVKHEDYFNADVFLLKPEFFHKNFELILEGCRFAYRHGYGLGEQDVLNYLFSTKYQKLPSRFNLVLNWERKLGKKPLRLEKAIYHFAGYDAKPSFDTDDIYNKLYLEYFLKTPWATADMFGNVYKALHENFRQLVNEYRNNLLNLSNLLLKRRRAFFINDNFFSKAKDIFEIKDDELVINSSSGVEKLITEITASDSKKVFFILADNYWQLRISLLKQNFKEGIDFIDAGILLSERHGLSFNFDSTILVTAL